MSRKWDEALAFYDALTGLPKMRALGEREAELKRPRGGTLDLGERNQRIPHHLARRVDQVFAINFHRRFIARSAARDQRTSMIFGRTGMAFSGSARAPPYYMVGIEKSAPVRIPVGQRDVTVLRRV